MKMFTILEQVLEGELGDFDFDDIVDALKSKKPYIAMKKIFPQNLWPKIERWINRKLKNVQLTKEEENLIGAPWRPKMDKYFKKDSPNYNDNVEAFVRELEDSYEEWSNMVNKPMDLPIKGGEEI